MQKEVCVRVSTILTLTTNILGDLLSFLYNKLSSARLEALFLETTKEYVVNNS
jgi:hypothetical protein